MNNVSYTCCCVSLFSFLLSNDLSLFSLIYIFVILFPVFVHGMMKFDDKTTLVENFAISFLC